MLMALAFVPLSDVEVAFDDLSDEIRFFFYNNDMDPVIILKTHILEDLG